jgi:trehalose 6-phosphate phosphatase
MTHAPFAGRMPVFVGDDLTDEAGFAAANRRRLERAGRRARRSLARHALPDIGAVHAGCAPPLRRRIPHLTAPRRIRPTDQGPA